MNSIQKNYFLIIISLLLILIGQTMYNHYEYSNQMNLSMQIERDSILRSNLQYKIIRESKITYIENLKSIPDSILFLMASESDKYNIPYVIFFRIMEHESKFQFVKNTQGSSALGYMQIIKSTFNSYYDKLGLTGGHTKANNIIVAANLIDTIHRFWKKKFKNKRTAWEFTVAEYGCGRGPLINGKSYSIPDSLRGGVNYTMKYYDKN